MTMSSGAHDAAALHGPVSPAATAGFRDARTFNSRYLLIRRSAREGTSPLPRPCVLRQCRQRDHTRLAIALDYSPVASVSSLGWSEIHRIASRPTRVCLWRRTCLSTAAAREPSHYWKI